MNENEILDKITRILEECDKILESMGEKDKVKHFTLQELTRSATALQLGIDNCPSSKALDCLAALTVNVLEPARNWLGKPIRVNSGYRCPALNARVGGAPNSQHCEGKAADITAGSIDENKTLFEWMKSHLQYDQLILEKGGQWIHVSYNNRNQTLEK